MCAAACYEIPLHFRPLVERISNDGGQWGIELQEVGSTFMDNASEQLLAAWPRVPAPPIDLWAEGGGKSPKPEDMANFKWCEFDTEEELRKDAWLRARSRGFKLPASIGVLILKSSPAKPQAAYLHVAVNHAVTDASSINPLVADLLELHEAAVSALQIQKEESDLTRPGRVATAEGTESAALDSGTVIRLAAAALKQAPLPPAPDGLELQEGQLRDSLLPPASSCLQRKCKLGVSSSSTTTNSSNSNALDLVHGAFNPRWRGHDHFIRLRPGFCRVLEVASKLVGAPADHLLVAALVAAFSHATGKSQVNLTLIVSMRDSIGKGQAIANLATTRQFTLAVERYKSLLDLALDVTNAVRRRQWDICDVLQGEGEGLMLNVRGLHGFRGAAAEMEEVDTRNRHTRYVRNIMEMNVDQESELSWALWMGVRHDVDGSKFAQVLRRSIWGFVNDPLATASVSDTTVHCESIKISALILAACRAN